MSYLVIIYRGIPEYKEFASETFSISKEAWQKITNTKFRKFIVDQYDIRKILNACEIVMNIDQPANYLGDSKILIRIQKIIDGQRSELDERYY